MSTIDSTFAAVRFPAEDAPEFKMVIAYEDFANGRYAIDFFDWIVAKFGKLFTFVPRFLKFEELMRPQVGERMTRELAGADMVVVAAYEEADLPSLVKDWLRTWGNVKRRNEAALVALLNTCQGSTTSQTPVRSHLRRVARRTGMKFLCQLIDWRRNEPQFPVKFLPRTGPGANGASKVKPFPKAGGRNGEGADASECSRETDLAAMRLQPTARAGRRL